MTKPQRSIAEIHDDMYIVLCSCTDPDHSVVVDYEVDTETIELYIKPSISVFSFKEKLKMVWSILITGRYEFGHSIVLDSTSSRNFSDLLLQLSEKAKYESN